jgi:hypothetical protein
LLNKNFYSLIQKKEKDFTVSGYNRQFFEYS